MNLIGLISLIVIVTTPTLQKSKHSKAHQHYHHHHKPTYEVPKNPRFIIPNQHAKHELKETDGLTPEAITITKKSGSIKDSELPGAFGSDIDLKDDYIDTSGSASTDDGSADGDTVVSKPKHDESFTQENSVAESASSYGSNIPLIPGINPTSAYFSNTHKTNDDLDNSNGDLLSTKHIKKHRKPKKLKIKNSKNTNETILSVSSSPVSSNHNTTPVSSKTTTKAKTVLSKSQNNIGKGDLKIDISSSERLKNKLAETRKEEKEDSDDEDEEKEEEKNIKQYKEEHTEIRHHSSIHRPTVGKVYRKYDGDGSDDDEDTTAEIKDITTKRMRHSTYNTTSTSNSSLYNMYHNVSTSRPTTMKLTKPLVTISKSSHQDDKDLYHTIEDIQKQIKRVETQALVEHRKENQTESVKEKKTRMQVDTVMKRIEQDLNKYHQKNHAMLLDKNFKNNGVNSTYYGGNNYDNISLKDAYNYYLTKTNSTQKPKIKSHFIYSNIKGDSSDAEILPKEFSNSNPNKYPGGLFGGPEGFECPWPCFWTCHSYCPKECCNNPYKCKPICRQFCTPYCSDKCCAPGSRRLPKLKIEFKSIAETGYNIAKLKQEKNEIEKKIQVIAKAQQYASQLLGLPATCPLFCNRVCAPVLCIQECCKQRSLSSFSSLLDPINKKIMQSQDNNPIVSEPVPVRNSYQLPPASSNVIPLKDSALSQHYVLDEIPLAKSRNELSTQSKMLNVVDVPFFTNKNQLASSIQLVKPKSQIRVLSSDPNFQTYNPLAKPYDGKNFQLLNHQQDAMNKALINNIDTRLSPYSSPLNDNTYSTSLPINSAGAASNTENTGANSDYCPPICRSSCIEECPNECCPNGGRYAKR